MNFHVITGEIVQQIGERFDKMTGPAVQKRRIGRHSFGSSPEKRNNQGNTS